MRPQAPKAAEPVKKAPVTQAQPKLDRGARWHGIINGVEGNYISDGSKLVLVDSAEGRLLPNRSGTSP